MSDAKRYYWLKLPENFYEDDTIQWLEDQENGATYVNFYLKLLLKSLSDDGRLIRYVGQRLIPYDVKSLARLTNTDTDTVRVALELFVHIGLVEKLNTGELYMSQIDEMIGNETEAARRKRKYRARNEIEGGTKELPSGTMSQQNETMSQQCPTEIRDRDRDRYRDRDRDRDITSSGSQETTTPQEHSDNSNWKKEVLDEWNKLDVNIPKIQTLNSGTKRYNSIKARVNQYGLSKVIEAIQSIDNSTFLKGYVNEWVISFDWFIRPNNFIKVMEGNYLDSKSSKTNKPNKFAEEDEGVIRI